MGKKVKLPEYECKFYAGFGEKEVMVASCSCNSTKLISLAVQSLEFDRMEIVCNKRVVVLT